MLSKRRTWMSRDGWNKYLPLREKRENLRKIAFSPFRPPPPRLPSNSHPTNISEAREESAAYFRFFLSCSFERPLQYLFLCTSFVFRSTLCSFSFALNRNNHSVENKGMDKGPKHAGQQKDTQESRPPTVQEHTSVRFKNRFGDSSLWMTV